MIDLVNEIIVIVYSTLIKQIQENVWTQTDDARIACVNFHEHSTIYRFGSTK